MRRHHAVSQQVTQQACSQADAPVLPWAIQMYAFGSSTLAETRAWTLVDVSQRASLNNAFQLWRLTVHETVGPSPPPSVEQKVKSKRKPRFTPSHPKKRE